MINRILAGIGANSVGMVITIGIQLVSLPMFLHYWDTSTYGVWLMLSAIPAYLSMADVGMVTAAGNKMTMAIAKDDVSEANRVFQSALMFMSVVCGILALFSLSIIFLAPLSALQTIDQRVALSALCVSVLLALFGGLSEAIFKSTKRYALGTMLGNYVRLGEWIGFMVGLVTIGSFAAVALCGLAIRLIGTLVSILLTRQYKDGLLWGFQAADGAEVRAMFKPAVSFMAFPLANALSFQGLTLLVGALFGPVAVALFNTYRTIARVAVQVTAIFSHAIWPEFSSLFGQSAFAAIEQLFRRSFWLSVAQALFLSLTLYLISPWMLRLWTHGAINFDPSLMLIMLLYAAVGGVWHVPRVFLMATNQHVGLAYWTLGAGGLSILLAWVLSDNLQLNGAVFAMLLSEMFIAIACTWMAFTVISNSSNNHQNRKTILQ